MAHFALSPVPISKIITRVRNSNGVSLIQHRKCKVSISSNQDIWICRPKRGLLTKTYFCLYVFGIFTRIISRQTISFINCRIRKIIVERNVSFNAEARIRAERLITLSAYTYGKFICRNYTFKAVMYIRMVPIKCPVVIFQK